MAHTFIPLTATSFILDDEYIDLVQLQCEARLWDDGALAHTFANAALTLMGDYELWWEGALADRELPPLPLQRMTHAYATIRQIRGQARKRQLARIIRVS